jgi:hypothetical protein
MHGAGVAGPRTGSARKQELELVAWSVEWRALITAARLPETIDPAGWAVRRDLVTDLPTSTTARLAAHSH